MNINHAYRKAFAIVGYTYFDSGEFPKVIFASMVNGDTDRCGGCGNEL